MKQFFLKMGLIALVATSATSTVFAAEDMGMRYGPGMERSAPRGGVGAQASVRIKLGDERTVKDEARIALGVAAGPVITMQDVRAPGGTRRSVAGVASFTLRPGHSTVVRLAGRPIHASYAERGQIGKEGERKNISTLGIVGIGAGVLIAVVLIAGAIAINSSNYDD